MYASFELSFLHAQGLSPELKVGALVGARRWPYHGAHPDCWGRPHVGVLLGQRDRRAWGRTLAFSEPLPAQAAVDRHVHWCREQVLLTGCVPVLWRFPDGMRVHWEGISGLRPARLHAEEWALERRASFAALGGVDRGVDRAKLL